MTTAIDDWMREGEEVYAAALKEYRALEARRDELERKVLAQRDKAIRILQLIHHSNPQSHRQVLACLMEQRGAKAIPRRALEDLRT